MEEDRSRREMELRRKIKRLTQDLFNDDVIKKLNSMQLNEARKFVKEHFEKLDINFDDGMIDLLIFTLRPGNCDSPIPPRPDWLDVEKFRKGQKFARDHIAAIFYAQLHGLTFLFSFVNDMKTLIFTRKSHTPYLSFKRYLSTGLRVRNWFTDDPWVEGTAAYKDIQTVRRMHGAVAKNLRNLNDKEFDERSMIDNPVCPMFDVVAKDVTESCSGFDLDRCLYSFFHDCPRKLRGINQTSLSLTLFGFMGLIVLYPTEFGLHDATDEELESFCHVWRVIGYLLGVEDEFNVCRGSLRDVRERAQSFIEFYVKPNLISITGEWEHMLRCVLEGFSYYTFAPTYENIILNIGDMLRIPMPRLYASLTYPQWISRHFYKFLSHYGGKLPIIRSTANKMLNYSLDKALLYNEEKHEELERKSTEWISNFSLNT